MQSEANFAGILGETFDLFRDAVRYIAVYVVVVGGLAGAGAIAGWAPPSDNLFKFGGSIIIDETSTVMSVLFQITALVVSVTASYFLLTKLLEIRGRLGSGGTRIWAFVGLSILWGIGFMLGLLLLVVPGIILLVRWSASTGYLLGAREDVVESLGRSWEATRGHSWAIFFAALVMFLGVGVVGASIGGAAGISGSATAVAIVSAAVNSFGNAFSFCFAIAVYCLVSNDAGVTAEVFE